MKMTEMSLHIEEIARRVDHIHAHPTDMNDVSIVAFEDASWLIRALRGALTELDRIRSAPASSQASGAE